MSRHEELLTELERAGLEAHHLPIGKPSQIADSFRNGIDWAMKHKHLGSEVFEAGVRHAALTQPKAGDVVADDDLEDILEARDIIDLMIYNIQLHGNYSEESTITFLDQARGSLGMGLDKLKGMHLDLANCSDEVKQALNHAAIMLEVESVGYLHKTGNINGIIHELAAKVRAMTPVAPQPPEQVQQDEFVTVGSVAEFFLASNKLPAGTKIAIDAALGAAMQQSLNETIESQWHGKPYRVGLFNSMLPPHDSQQLKLIVGDEEITRAETRTTFCGWVKAQQPTAPGGEAAADQSTKEELSNVRLDTDSDNASDGQQQDLAGEVAGLRLVAH